MADDLLLNEDIKLALIFRTEEVSKKMNTSRVDVDGLIEEGREKFNVAAEKGMDYVASANSFLTDFIREEPLIAIASAFAVGYVAARILSHLSRR